MTQHAQMTSEEWVDDWVREAVAVTNTNPVTTPAHVPPLPKGAVVANIAGGVYFATASEVSDVLMKYGTPGGQKLRSQLYNLVGHDTETHKFYREATVFEVALIVAWHTSVLNQAPYYM